ncbi:Thiosulfate sulfurtransferase GlpE [Candidatus Anstonella stagnisolia]|nr:Thiosulfate sulfurtransferase GlpE [Candidatus Anstonella stagnisolia]
MAIKAVSAAEYLKRKHEFLLVDVRTQDEWEEGHEEEAVHIPLDELEARMGELPKKPLAIICHSGGRSAAACGFLSSAGLDACNVTGGMSALIREKSRR